MNNNLPGTPPATPSTIHIHIHIHINPTQAEPERLGQVIAQVVADQLPQQPPPLEVEKDSGKLQ